MNEQKQSTLAQPSTGSEARERVEAVFTYQPPQDHDLLIYKNLREMAKRFGIFIIEHCPASEDRNEAINKLREVIFWANSSIALRESKRG